MHAPDFFARYREVLDPHLQYMIDSRSAESSRLSEALKYSTLLGGKRIRPILLMATAESFGASLDTTLTPAAAIEMIHAYSLIHDDLPAMDDDDLRRGQPACHIAFDEATAVLAGDALQTMAFECLCDCPGIEATQKLAMIQVLTKASGARGMVLGQAIDLESVDQPINLSQLEHMHLNKTGALIEASVVIGALCAGKPLNEEDALEPLRHFARALGLAFQVQDDILDVTGDTETLGKQQGADIARNKPTYPALLGVAGARQKLSTLKQDALDALADIPSHDVKRLNDICHFVVDRAF